MTWVCRGLCFIPLSVVLSILQGIKQARSGGRTQPHSPVTAVSFPAYAVCSYKVGVEVTGQDVWGSNEGPLAFMTHALSCPLPIHSPIKMGDCPLR